METLRHVLTYPVLGLPLWNVALFWLILPLVNELIARNPKWRAQSALQAVANLVATSPLAKVPLVAQTLLIFTVFKTPTPPSLDGAEVVARKDGQR